MFTKARTTFFSNALFHQNKTTRLCFSPTLYLEHKLSGGNGSQDRSFANGYAATRKNPNNGETQKNSNGSQDKSFANNGSQARCFANGYAELQRNANGSQARCFANGYAGTQKSANGSQNRSFANGYAELQKNANGSRDRRREFGHNLYGGLQVAEKPVREKFTVDLNRIHLEQLLHESVFTNQQCIELLEDFCKDNYVHEAVQMLEKLETEGVYVDFPRYLLLIQACTQVGILEYAKRVHAHLIRSNTPVDVNTSNQILDMYSESGSMSDAYHIFENMPERNLTSWGMMITGLAKNGLGEDAIDLFTQFKEAGLKPDGQLFMGVFLACSVVCDIDEGMLHFESMSKVYGIVPSMEHYVSIVNMLGSTGYLDEAMEFIEKMPFEPNIDVWETLMNCCIAHGNLELGDHCAKIVSYLDPSYLTDKSKQGLLPVKASDIAKEREKKKLFNVGTIYMSEVGPIDKLKSGNTFDPEKDEVYPFLRGMIGQIKADGYLPCTKCVLFDAEKEDAEESLLSHRGKLTVASHILHSRPRAEVRILKQCYTCKDCHEALKFISKLVGRTIFLLNGRIHQFKDGLCSCKDYMVGQLPSKW